jgi:translation initiation factor IF-1
MSTNNKTNSKFGATHKKRHEQRKGEFVNKELILANPAEGEFYGIIMEEKGNCRFVVEDTNGRRIQASISKSWKKGPNKERVKVSDTVKIEPGISKDQYHITHKYDSSEVATLHSRGLIGKPKSDKEIDESDLEAVFKIGVEADEAAVDNNNDLYDINDL